MPDGDSKPLAPLTQHDTRIGSLEIRVTAHDGLLASLAATVERNEAANQQSREGLTVDVADLSKRFGLMEAEQKSLPSLVYDMHEAIVGTPEKAGIAEEVRGLKAKQAIRGQIWWAVLGAALTLFTTLVGWLAYFVVFGRPSHP